MCVRVCIYVCLSLSLSVVYNTKCMYVSLSLSVCVQEPCCGSRIQDGMGDQDGGFFFFFPFSFETGLLLQKKNFPEREMMVDLELSKFSALVYLLCEVPLKKILKSQRTSIFTLYSLYTVPPFFSWCNTDHLSGPDFLSAMICFL